VANEPNVVNPGGSPTPSTPSPLPAGSSATPGSASTGAVTPGTTPSPAIQVRPPEGFVPKGALDEERNKRQALDTKLQQLKAIFGDKFQEGPDGSIVPIAPAPQQGAQAPQDVQAMLDKLWEEDPRKAIQTEMSMAFQWYDQVNSNLNYQKSILRSQKSDFARYEADIDKYIAKLPVGQRSQNGVVELAYLVTRGQNADTIKQTAIDELIARIQKGESIQGISGGTFTPSSTPNTDQPTQDEIKVAEAMNMPVTEYMKNKRK